MYPDPVLRGLLILSLVVFGGQAAGLPELLESAICQECCPGDGPDGQCPPGCTYCCCCAHSPRPLVMVEPLEVLALSIRADTPPDVERAPRPSEPHDIFHVPRPLSLQLTIS